jgi:hypothetical protein
MSSSLSSLSSLPVSSLLHPLVRTLAYCILGSSVVTALYVPSLVSSVLLLVISAELLDLAGSGLHELAANVAGDDISSSSPQRPSSHSSSRRGSSSSGRQQRFSLGCESRLTTLFNLGIAVVVFSVLECLVTVGFGINAAVIVAADGPRRAVLASFIPFLGDPLLALVGLAGGLPAIAALHITWVVLVWHICSRAEHWPRLQTVGGDVGAVAVVVASSSSTPNTPTPLPPQTPLDPEILSAAASLAHSLTRSIASAHLGLSVFLLLVSGVSVLSTACGVGLGVALLGLAGPGSAPGFWSHVQTDPMSVLARKFGRSPRRCSPCTFGCGSDLANVHGLSVSVLVFASLELLFVLVNDTLVNPLVFGPASGLTPWRAWILGDLPVALVVHGCFVGLALAVRDAAGAWPLVGDVREADGDGAAGAGGAAMGAGLFSWLFGGGQGGSSSSSSSSSAAQDWARSGGGNRGSANAGKRNGGGAARDREGPGVTSPIVVAGAGASNYGTYGGGGNVGAAQPSPSPSSSSSLSTTSYSASPASASSSTRTLAFAARAGGSEALVRQALALVNAKAGDVATEADMLTLIPRVAAAVEDIADRNSSSGGGGAANGGTTMTEEAQAVLGEQVVRAIFLEHRVDVVTTQRWMIKAGQRLRGTA